MKVALIHKDDQRVFDWIQPELEVAGHSLVICASQTPDEVLEVARDAEVVWDMGGVQTITAAILPELGSCGAIIRGGSGTDNIPVREATELGIVVANTPDATAVAVPEHTMALILSFTRKVPMHDYGMAAGGWTPKEPLPVLLKGQTIGLVGFGRIARGVANRLRGFEVVLIACDPFPADSDFAQHGVRRCELPELLGAADVVSLHTPLTNQTRHLIGAAELALMKETAVLVNTSRGPVVDSQALLEALEGGQIGGAALDVFESEPPDELAKQLVALPNVVATPHTGGHSPNMLDTFCRLSVDTIHNLAAGRWPRSYVNPDVRPRWSLR